MKTGENKVKKRKLLIYNGIIKKVRQKKDGLTVLMSLYSGKDIPFCMNLKFTGKELCEDLLKDRTLISIRASGTGNRINYLKSVTLVSFENSKNGKLHSIHKEYPLEKIRSYKRIKS